MVRECAPVVDGDSAPDPVSLVSRCDGEPPRTGGKLNRIEAPCCRCRTIPGEINGPKCAVRRSARVAIRCGGCKGDVRDVGCRLVGREFPPGDLAADVSGVAGPGRRTEEQERGVGPGEPLVRDRHFACRIHDADIIGCRHVRNAEIAAGVRIRGRLPRNDDRDARHGQSVLSDHLSRHRDNESGSAAWPGGAAFVAPAADQYCESQREGRSSGGKHSFQHALPPALLCGCLRNSCTAVFTSVSRTALPVIARVTAPS